MKRLDIDQATGQLMSELYELVSEFCTLRETMIKVTAAIQENHHVSRY